MFWGVSTSHTSPVSLMLPACLPTSYIPNHRVHNIFYRSHEFDMSWDQHTSGVECVKKKKEGKKEGREEKRKKKGKTTLQLSFAGQGSHRLLGQKKKIGHRIFIIVLFFTWQSFRKP